MQMESLQGLATRKKDKLKEPDDYKVVLFNDDWTTMDFVVGILMQIFHKTYDDAERIMFNVHKTGRGIAGVYAKDVAETKVLQVSEAAVKSGFPLRCVAEKV